MTEEEIKAMREALETERAQKAQLEEERNRLVSFKETVLAEKKAADEKRRAAEEEQERLRLEKLAADGKAEELKAQYEQKVSSLQKETVDKLAAFEKKIASAEKSSTINRVLAELSIDKEDSDVVEAYISKFTNTIFENGECKTVILDKNGNQVDGGVSALVESLKAIPAIKKLSQPSGASGGGARIGSANGVKKFSDYKPMELMELKKTNPALFEEVMKSK